MSRFPKPGRKPKNKLSIFQQARRFYGEAFEASTNRDLADAMADWSDLGAPERTFTLSHLLYLNLMAQAGVQTLLHELLVTAEDVADDLGGEGDGGDDDDDEDDDDQDEEVEDLEDDSEPEEEPELDDDEVEDSSPELTDGPPPGVTIPGPGPVVITPPVGEDDQVDEGDDDDQDDGSDPDELDEDGEG